MPNETISLRSSVLMTATFTPDETHVDRGELVLAFRNGHTYTLESVPRSEFENLANASSPGSYFNSNLKGQY